MYCRGSKPQWAVSKQLLVHNEANWIITGSNCQMWVVPEPLPRLFVQALIYVEYQMERAGDRCTLTLLYIHSSSWRLLEACCPAGRPVGWNRKDTQSFFESGAEIKLLGARREGEKSTSLREKSAPLWTVHWCIVLLGSAGRPSFHCKLSKIRLCHVEEILL